MSQERFKMELEEKLDDLFPKKKCKDRGKGLVLYTWACLFFKKYSQKTTEDK